MKKPYSLHKHFIWLGLLCFLSDTPWLEARKPLDFDQVVWDELEDAAKRGNIEAFQQAVYKYHLPLNINSWSWEGRYRLIQCIARYGHQTLLQLLIEEHDLYVREVFPDQKTFLEAVILAQASPSLIDYLVNEHGLPIKQLNALHQNALFAAAKANNPELYNHLFEKYKLDALQADANGICAHMLPNEIGGFRDPKTLKAGPIKQCLPGCSPYIQKILHFRTPPIFWLAPLACLGIGAYFMSRSKTKAPLPMTATEKPQKKRVTAFKKKK